MEMCYFHVESFPFHSYAAIGNIIFI